MHPCAVILCQSLPSWPLSEAPSAGSAALGPLLLDQGNPCSEALSQCPSPAVQLPAAEAAQTPPWPALPTPNSQFLKSPAPAWPPKWPATQIHTWHALPGLWRRHATSLSCPTLGPLSSPGFLSTRPQLEGSLSNANWIVSWFRLKYFRG